MAKPLSFLSLITGSFSTPAGGNPTVAMMDAAYAHHGVDARYINCEVAPARLAAAVAGARAMGWVGFNLSLPHKVAVIEHLDGLGQSAEIMEAVNCVVKRGDKYVGENTDGKGFLKSLVEVADPRDKRIVMFGAGGAARAIAVELALAGAEAITVVNRSAERGGELARLVAERTKASVEYAPWTRGYAVPGKTDIVINATSIGLEPDDKKFDIDFASLRPETIVTDVIINPRGTRFMQDAAAQGCKVVDGLGMVVNQAVINIKYWTGVDADASVMRNTLMRLLG